MPTLRMELKKAKIFTVRYVVTKNLNSRRLTYPLLVLTDLENKMFNFIYKIGRADTLAFRLYY